MGMDFDPIWGVGSSKCYKFHKEDNLIEHCKRYIQQNDNLWTCYNCHKNYSILKFIFITE